MTTPEELDALQERLDCDCDAQICTLKDARAAITALRARVAELEARADEPDPWAIVEKLRVAHRDEIHHVWMPLVAELKKRVEAAEAELARRGQGAHVARNIQRDAEHRAMLEVVQSGSESDLLRYRYRIASALRASLVSPGDGSQDDPAKAFDKADWFWRTMDPDDCGDSPEEAINRAMVGQFCVCEIASSYSGPTRYGFIAPVLDPDSDDEEFVHFATQEEAIAAAKARSAPPASEGADHG